MKLAANQFDLFGTEAKEPVILQPVATAPRARIAAVPTVGDEEELARQLESTGRFRVLRKLVPRPVIDRADSPFERLGILVDTETTGLQYTQNEIIEIGAVAFTYADDGRIGDVVGVFSALQQPTAPIPAEITRLTGITDEMVAGQTIDIDALEQFIAPADLIVAHNARFDRPFCENLSPVFAPKPWACSVSEIRWADHGFEGTKLGYLVGQAGLFHDGHRATDDCHALLEVLSLRVGMGAGTPFAELLEASTRARIRIYAENSPFDMKDRLKGRGYRWSDGSDGRPKAWWTEVAEEESDDELHFLRTEIYRWKDAEPLTLRLSALDRFRVI